MLLSLFRRCAFRCSSLLCRLRSSVSCVRRAAPSPAWCRPLRRVPPPFLLCFSALQTHGALASSFSCCRSFASSSPVSALSCAGFLLAGVAPSWLLPCRLWPRRCSSCSSCFPRCCCRSVLSSLWAAASPVFCRVSFCHAWASCAVFVLLLGSFCLSLLACFCIGRVLGFFRPSPCLSVFFGLRARPSSLLFGPLIVASALARHLSDSLCFSSISLRFALLPPRFFCLCGSSGSRPRVVPGASCGFALVFRYGLIRSVGSLRPR